MPTLTAPLALLEALTTPHAPDRYTQLLNPMLTVRELRARVEHVDRTVPGSTRLLLKPTRQWRGFRAGQFVRLGVLIDGRWHTRCYSPANSEYDRRVIELVVKAHEDGLVSKHLYTEAEPGMVLQLAPATGGFVLPDERPDRVLLISAGSGITPVLSMLRTLLDEQFGGQIAFLHYAADARHVPASERLRRAAAERPNLTLALGYPNAPAQQAGGLRGRFGIEHLRQVAPWFDAAETFVCGPPGLTEAVRRLYVDRGLAHRLHQESFAPATASAPVGDAGGRLGFTRAGTSVANSGATVLEQAEAAGLTPEHGCRMGICFSCTAVKTSGCTRNVRTGELDENPDSEIQICLHAPVGDVEIDL